MATQVEIPLSISGGGMSMNTTIAGRTWTLVNHWENKWHWACTSDATMRSKIVTASNFTEAVAALKAKLQIT